MVNGSLVLAVREWNQNAVDPGTEGQLTRDDAFFNANESALPHDTNFSAGLNTRSTSDELASGETQQRRSVGYRIFAAANTFPQTGPPESIKAQILAQRRSSWSQRRRRSSGL